MVVVRARFVDSTHLELAQPFAAHQGEQVIISIAEPGDTDTEREDWYSLSLESLSRAYGDSEPEYPVSLVKEFNPDYKP